MMRWSLWMCLISFHILSSPFLLSSSSSSFNNTSLCHPDDGSALLQFKNSFSIHNDPNYYYDYNCNNKRGSSKTLTWKNGTDCCTWSGVKCDKVTGNVIELDLHCSNLQGIIDSNSSLFFLGHLQSLDLSHNFFYGSQISPHFGRFTSMKHLNLSYTWYAGQVPHEISYLSELITLDLSFNVYAIMLETSTLQRITTNLTSLKVLRLLAVDMSSAQPYSLMNLSSSLTFLDLSDSDMQGKFPENIFRLPNLQVVDLSGSENLRGSFPESNWSSSPIRELSLSKTAFSIDVTYLIQNLKSLNGLYLRNCKFIRPSPALMVANFSKITSLDFSGNNFTGHILRNNFFNLQHLISLDLSDNNFEGQLPETNADAHVPMNLEYLNLGHNKLNGTIPSWLYSLPVLRRLDLSYNQFIGTIQEFQHASLGYLDLGHNKLHGPVPVSVFQQDNLTYLDLSRNNLSGAVGLDQFSKLKNLEELSLSYNNLLFSFDNSDNYTLPHLIELELSSCNISEFPYFLRDTESLRYLDLSHNKIQGNIPKWMLKVGVDTLEYLNLSRNLLTAHVPEQLPWTNLTILDLRSNLIQGHLPIPPPSTRYYFISNNQLRGEIPSLICTLESIDILDLSNNTLNGSIPLCLGNLSFLSVLDLRMNMFDGKIPTIFSEGNTLRNIALNGNRLKGPLPRALLNCRNLEILDLGNNMINDTFPRWLESLPKLQILILRSNKFHGSLRSPKARFPFTKLRIMDLSNNNFSGVLPTKYIEHFMAMMLDGHVDQLSYMGEDLYQDSVSVTMKGLEMELEHILNIFTTIDFSKNNFDGGIPESLGNLKSLKGLNLSHNKISGHIPTSLGNLTNLEWLDLSSNYLSGEIPMQLTEITSLAVFNLSKNHLVGAIPRGNQFNSFANDSYIGNLGLCGFPLTKTCGNDPGRAQQPSPTVIDHQEHTNGFEWKYVFMGYASGLIIGISVGYMFFSDERLACLMRKFGGDRWVKLLKRRRRNRRFSRRRRN